MSASTTRCFSTTRSARLGMPPPESIPDAQAVAAQGLTEWTFPGTDIKIVKITEGEHAGQFLFSSETVRRARQLLRPGAEFARTSRLRRRGGHASGLARTADARTLGKAHLGPAAGCVHTDPGRAALEVGRQHPVDPARRRRHLAAVAGRAKVGPPVPKARIGMAGGRAAGDAPGDHADRRARHLAHRCDRAARPADAGARGHPDHPALRPDRLVGRRRDRRHRQPGGPFVRRQPPRARRGADPSLLPHPEHYRRLDGHSLCGGAARLEHHPDHRRPRRRRSRRGPGDPADAREHRRRLRAVRRQAGAGRGVLQLRQHDGHGRGDRAALDPAARSRPHGDHRAECRLRADADRQLHPPRHEPVPVQARPPLRDHARPAPLRRGEDQEAADPAQQGLARSRPRPLRRVRQFGLSSWTCSPSSSRPIGTNSWRSRRISTFGSSRSSANSGTGFAFPSQTVYLTRDHGIDTARGTATEAEVQQWREENRLPFPEYDFAERAEMAGTMPFPPEGSPDFRPAPPRAADTPGMPNRPKSRWQGLFRHRKESAPAP